MLNSNPCLYEYMALHWIIVIEHSEAVEILLWNSCCLTGLKSEWITSHVVMISI